MPTTAESVGVVVVLSLALKLLLLPACENEEFERQRRVMALTHELPMKEWYLDDGSEYQLDIPPMFAYLKLAMAHVVVFLFGEKALSMSFVDDHSSCSSVARVTGLSKLERINVILMDSILLFGILLFCATWPSITTTDMAWSRNKVIVVVALILFNPGLIMVDHISLHYTGFTLGVLFSSIAFLRRGDDFGDITGGVLFIVLLFFDHTFLAILPLYIIYLYRHFGCLADTDNWNVPTAKSRSLSLSPRADHTLNKGNDEDSCDADEMSDSDQSDGSEEQARVEEVVRRVKQRRKARLDAQPRGVILESLLHQTGNSAIERPRAGSKSQQNSPLRPLKGLHRRIKSETRDALRIQQGYGKFKQETSFKKLLQRPRGVANLEIESQGRSMSCLRVTVLFLHLGGTVLFLLTPLFLAHGQPQQLTMQLVLRLHANKSSLMRPFWAPNIWALYASLDRLLTLAAHACGWDVAPVQTYEPIKETDFEFALLPSISPWITMIITGLAMLPALSRLWKVPHHSMLMPVFVYCMTCAYMLGYHVHEKSVLLIILPLTLTACDSTMDARLYLVMSWIAHVSLLPLLENADLKILKPVLLLVHCCSSYIALDQYHIMARRERRIRPEPNGGGVWLWAGDRVYFCGLVLAYLFVEVVFPCFPFFGILEIGELLEVPMIIVSTYCAVGMVHCWGLAFQQVCRKVRLIESYQWSPQRTARSAEEVKSDSSIPLLPPHLNVYGR